MKPTFAQNIHLRVTVTIEMEAEDFFEAAEHQRRLEASMIPLLEAYPSASVVLSRGRGARGEIPNKVRVPQIASGKVRHYG